MDRHSKDGIRLFVYKERVFTLGDCIQPPDVYSIFLEQNILIADGDIALDITTGSGFHAIMMADRAKQVVGIDIDVNNVKCAKRNVLLNELENKVQIRTGDLFSAIDSEEKFDLIVAWPPVLPTPPQKERNDPIGITNNAGIDGRKYIDQIIIEAPKYLNKNGRLQILHAWYNNIPKSLSMMERIGFNAKVTAEKKFPLGRLSFERLEYLIKLGFPPFIIDGLPWQSHSVVTGRTV